MIKKIGTFQTSNDVLRISDPCYDKKVWCSGKLKNCKVGKWSAFIEYSDEGSWGTRVAECIAIFGDASVLDAEEFLPIASWKDTNIPVGVDSGQAGIFQDSKYPNDESTGEYGDTKTFYGKCCDLTLGKEQGGVLDFGVVTSTGYGDGSYNCLISETDGKISAIRIIFLSGDDEETNLDDYEQDED